MRASREPARADGRSLGCLRCRASDPDAGASPWWRAGVLYQIYPRSFADSTGNGHGDLRGVIEHLDHLSWLGIDGIWLSPINPSPDADWGYDVADYTDVDPDFGTLEDLDRLVAEAADRGIRVLIDLVPNHTSDRHPWFVEARSSRSSERRDWYVWADGGPDGVTAQQLAIVVRRPGVDLGRDDRASTTSTTSCRSSRT